MGAQSLLSRLSANVYVPSFKDFKGLQPTKWSSMATEHTYGLAPCRIRSSKRPVLCAVSSQKVEDFPADSGRHNLNHNRKRLAVFVSGGGSNFKAIHEATLKGSVLGDVVVLVTNKGGCGGAA